MDNGLELTANDLQDWCRFSGAGTSRIEPGSPGENSFIQSFNGKLRDELLDGQVFETLLEARLLAEDFRIDYNTYRPHSALGQQAPSTFAELWSINQARLSELVYQQSGQVKRAGDRAVSLLLTGVWCRSPRLPV